jgi:hypothetical protein
MPGAALPAASAPRLCRAVLVRDRAWPVQDEGSPGVLQREKRQKM